MSEIIESSEVTEEQITDNEEVTEEVTEEPTEIQEETDEQQETEEKPEEEKEEDFNPENATFEDESLYQIEGYDLTEFKEVVDLGDSEKRQQAESQLKQLKEMGFTQDQIKFLINNAVQYTGDDKKIFIGIVTRRDIIQYCYDQVQKENLTR